MLDNILSALYNFNLQMLNLVLNLPAVTPVHYLYLALLIFCLAIFGLFINRYNLLNILLMVELMLLAVNLALVSTASFSQDISGQILALMVIVVAATEVAVGLALFLLYYRKVNDIKVKDLSRIHG